MRAYTPAVPERLAWRASTAGEALRLFWLRAFVHVCFRRHEGARQAEQLESTSDTMSGGVVTTFAVSVTQMGVDGRWRRAASGERDGERGAAMAEASGDSLRGSIERLER